MKTCLLHVSWTHCASCKILIEDVLSEETRIKNARVDLKNQTLSFETNVSDMESLVDILNKKMKPHDYVFSSEKIGWKKWNKDVIWQAIPIGLAFLILFFLLQKSGILNLGLGGAVTPTTSFIIGLIASVSSCLAVVGGLILSLSAKIAQDDKKNTRPFILFHIARLAGFAILGGILGLVGKTIGVSFMLTSILGIIAALIMILLGLNLMGVIGKSVTLHSGIFSFFRKVEHKFFAPIFLGIGTFFLPCGFTQSMQLTALSSGWFLSGSLIMFFFALGTLPILAMLSFGSVSFARSSHAPLFFASSGVVVVGLGIFAFLSGLAWLGVIPPLFSI